MQEGWRQADDSCEGVMFLPVDCPAVKTSSIDTIIGHFEKSAPDILIPTYQGQKGHPPVFHRRLKPEAFHIPSNQGLNSLFADHPPQTVEIDDPGIVKSFNTPEELEAIKK